MQDSLKNVSVLFVCFPYTFYPFCFYEVTLDSWIMLRSGGVRVLYSPSRIILTAGTFSTFVLLTYKHVTCLERKQKAICIFLYECDIHNFDMGHRYHDLWEKKKKSHHTIEMINAVSSSFWRPKKCLINFSSFFIRREENKSNNRLQGVFLIRLIFCLSFFLCVWEARTHFSLLLSATYLGGFLKFLKQDISAFFSSIILGGGYFWAKTKIFLFSLCANMSYLLSSVVLSSKSQLES